VTELIEHVDRSGPLPKRDWNWDAACKGEPSDLFFQPYNVPDARDGRLICCSCPVQRDCLIDALRINDQDGVRGGFLPRERRRTMRRLGGNIFAAIVDFDNGVFYQPNWRPEHGEQ
jgi:WhiB family redox-sensing transcriptional regulator